MKLQDCRLVSCREVDAAFRLRHGTASAAVKAGLLPGRRRGKALMVSLKRANELWGAND